MTVRKLKLIASILAAASLSTQAFAQDLPKMIKIVVPYTAGGAGDVLTRVLAQSIAQKNNISVIVEDKPGAASVVGTEFVSRSTPDGSTLLLVENPFVLSAVLHPHVHYDPVSSFEPICFVADTPAVLAVSAKSDIQSLKSFIQAAQAKPGALTYGSTGPASIVYIAGELLKRAAHADVTYVPYPGSPPAMNAVLSGHVTAVIANYSDLKGQLSAGGLRPLAVPASERVEPLPEVPTLKELGYGDIEASVWFGFVAPKGTPKPILDKVASALSDALQVPEVKNRVHEQGLIPKLSCGGPFGDFLANQKQNYTTFVRDFDIKAE
jgi:tripartite-type tricarboxylate transporter receptor subunit TctC